jgi:basic membrane protein A
MGKITVWLLAAGILLTGCTKDGETIILPTPGEEQPSTTPLVTVIYDPDGLGDRSYNDLIYKGVEEAAKKYGLRTLQLVPENREQGLAYLETMFKQIENLNDTVRRLFVTPSIVYDAYIRANNKCLETNPYADLLFMETAKPLDGKGSTFYIDYYGAMYMSGCMVHYAAWDLVSLLLANPYIQTVKEAGDGFQAGFNDTPQLNVDKPLLLDVRYLSEDPVGGFKIADSTATRIFNEERHYISGKNVNNVTLVPVCGGAMHAFFRAAKSIVSSYKYVGVDGDMTPVVLPKDAGQNVLFFWSGHGRSKAINGINEMVWRNLSAGRGMTDNLLAETLRTMAANKQFRQMLVCLEPCYSANMGEALEGIPGVLAICAAGPYEQSFADSWSNDLGVWMCDRFSRNLVGHASSNPNGTYRDLYLYCAQHTLGSHVGIYNYENFGNLYTTGPKDFFVRK